VSRARVEAPSLAECAAAILASILLVFTFPDFNLWPLAWVGLVPLLIAIARRPVLSRAFLLGWITGSLFFFGSCHWLTYSMVHYGRIPGWIAYLLLIPGALALGLFPAAFALVLASAARLLRTKALFLAPFIWVAFEWARLGVTGQLWNAIGYSQAYKPLLIQSAYWGGVYGVSFLIVSTNAALAFMIVNRCKRAVVITTAVLAVVAILVLGSNAPSLPREAVIPAAHVVALQPNVPMDLVKSAEEMRELTTRHINMSKSALRQLPNDGLPRLVIWPESPMNFTYASDSQFREFISGFARANNTALLFNSQEPAPNDGIYNSAVLINEAGRLIGQYDKIRLMPFGEYVPLPRWLPGANLITAMVGEFSPGTNYKLLSVGSAQAGVFICIESAYPWIARTFAREGADVLINISNDGYLGRTAVMRQHLANAVFRAVENGRPVVRVTNTGITAYITAKGEVRDQTSGFEPAVRIWTVTRNQSTPTFYTKHGDIFALVCGVLTVLIFIAWLARRSEPTH
ncbi:MAG: apolipoprotein N-acyltransferase, partial [Pyrinomonadaceae bacterium]